MQDTPFARNIGLSLAEAAWQRAADETEQSVVRHVDFSARSASTASAGDYADQGEAEAPARLPLTDVELHVGFPDGLDPWEHFARLLRRIDRVARATGRRQPTPAEQDTVTGCLRQLLPRLASADPRDERVRAAFQPAIDGDVAVRRALDTAWVAVISSS